MADGGDLFSPYIRRGREGTQFERTFRVLCYLLHEWCFYPGVRAEIEGEPSKGFLRAIYFDKFAALVARIWNECFRMTGRGLRDKLDALQEPASDAVVTFPFPLQELPGKHGRGLARIDEKTKRPHYILQILHEVGQEGLCGYFTIDVHDGNPSDYRTTVRPGVEIPDPDSFLEPFTRKEKTILKDLATALRRLGPLELRALGTHRDKSGTIKDIDKEFDDLEARQAWDTVLDSLTHGNLSKESAEELLEYADEAWRKSVKNRDHYTHGRETFLSECRDPTVREAFQSAQAEPHAVWDSDEMRARADCATKLRAIAQYIVEVAHSHAHPIDHTTIPVRRRDVGQAAYDALVKCKIADGLTSNPAEAFNGNPSELKASIRERLVQILTALRASTHG